MFKQHNNLKIKDVYRFSVACYVFKCIKKGQFLSDPPYATRNSNSAPVTFQRLSISQRSLSYIGPRIWNSIPSNIRNIVNYKQFKARLKSYFVEQYLEL